MFTIHECLDKSMFDKPSLWVFFPWKYWIRARNTESENNLCHKIMPGRLIILHNMVLSRYFSSFRWILFLEPYIWEEWNRSVLYRWIVHRFHPRKDTKLTTLTPFELRARYFIAVWATIFLPKFLWAKVWYFLIVSKI